MPPPRPTAMQVARAHPWITWSTLAAIATVLGFLCTGAAFMWSQVQTTADAKSQAKRYDTKLAWTNYAVANLTTLTLRNRVNDCMARAATNPLEHAICDQYKSEYDEAAQRSKDAYNAAIATGKEQ